MSLWRRLRFRLFASYVAVIGVGAVAVYVVSRQVAPDEVARRLRAGGQGRGLGGPPSATADLQQLVGDSIDAALTVGIVVAAVAAGLLALLVGSRLLKPIDAVRSAADDLAKGDYHTRVPVPDELELAQLAADINTLAETLEGTERRRTQLIGEVAHELRTPLTTIEGYMEALLDGVQEPNDETFAAVAEEAARLHRLSDDLTLLSRAEEGALALDRQSIDLADIAEKAAVRLRPQFEHRDVALIVNPESASVEADPDRIYQVVVNLVGNALAYTPAKGTVTVSTGSIHGEAWLEVSDTGRGIPREELNRVFERFYRLPHPDNPPGRGIGLTIARSIVRAHGGDISAQSDGLGTGATFRVAVPRR
jgi:histidine kinase